MEEAARRRQDCRQGGHFDSYRQTVRSAVERFYGELPVGRRVNAPAAIRVSSFEKNGYRLENVLFDSFPGWQVNATVYVPLDFKPPFPAVVVPVGHSGKQFAAYQLPAQFFARAGYLAVLFDPPGQAGEKQPGNDHFVDGVRCYLVGESSSRYFVADALRTIDYLETRSDVDLGGGVAMTGVSGGGTTTTLAGVLDERISVLGPSCCVTPLADLDITQCYAGCPETHPWRRYADGVDETDLLCAALPTPTLLMAGALDEVFRIEDTRRLAAEVKGFFEAAGVGERFEFFIDPGGHDYSLRQAREFTRFMNRWLLDAPARPIPELPDSCFALDPYEELQCRPRTDVNMKTLTRNRACEIERFRRSNAEEIRKAAVEIAGAAEMPVPAARVGEPFRVWTHEWLQILLVPEEDIELPATLLLPVKRPAGAILHFDAEHRNRLIQGQGPLARAAGFLNGTEAGVNLLSVDLRGWGDTSPALYPYEMAGWGSVDRTLAYMSNALGDPLLAMRIRDGLAALSYLRSRTEVVAERIVVTGSGLAGIVALHVAAIDGKVAGVVIWDCLASFESLLEVDRYPWPADVFLPRVLLRYDLPHLAQSLSTRVVVLRPLDGAGQPLPESALEALNLSAGRQIYQTSSDHATIVRSVRSMS